MNEVEELYMEKKEIEAKFKKAVIDMKMGAETIKQYLSLIELGIYTDEIIESVRGSIVNIGELMDINRYNPNKASMPSIVKELDVINVRINSLENRNKEMEKEE